MRHTTILFFFLFSYIASAQISFKTGNVQLDSDLNTINAKANLDFGTFKTDISLSYNIAEKKIEYMRGTLKMAPGEIYLALEISKISHTSLDDILDIYKKHNSKGWGYIAKMSGIKPGSAEFHQLKNNCSNKIKKDKGKKNMKTHGKRTGKNK